MNIITYKHNDNTQISPHFNAQEFKCKCGQSHDFNVADALVENLEKLYSELDCSKIVITSGFRCVQHDKKVGGSGAGQHTLGTAADICCYAKNGAMISSKEVCKKAQDIGFKGIANINADYLYTHVDMRTGGKWYGDETKGNGTVTSDFYEYFGDAVEMRGIDVSAYQGVIDWQKVKASGIKFAILRAGLGKLSSQKDVKFEQNYSGAKAAGVPIGAYWYSYAQTVSDAEKEAAACIEVLKGKQFEFPIWFDLEELSQFKTGKANCSAIVKTFCNALEAAGYWAGLYTSRSAIQNYITDDVKSRYAMWIAEWGAKLNYSGAVGMWQNSEKGSVNGINGAVDTDICYVDYERKIKAAGLNGWENEPEKPVETYKPLKKGDKGEEVELIQLRLYENGYLRKNEIDGDFGTITLGALCAFQLEHNLTVNGICGKETIAELAK